MNGRKSIAFASTSPRWRCAAIDVSGNDEHASIAAKITRTDAARAGDGDCLSVLGLWTRGPDYADEAIRIINCHDAIFAAGPTVVLGDFNSGTHLGRREPVSRPHARLVAALESRGLVSGYHAFHRVRHGAEKHATYFHRFDRSDRWHIDFCFIPSAWATRIRTVVVGRPGAHTTSDHRPVMVEVEAGGVRDGGTSGKDPRSQSVTPIGEAVSR